MQRGFLEKYAEKLEQDFASSSLAEIQISFAPKKIRHDLLVNHVCKAMSEYIERSLERREFVSMYLIISMCKRHLYHSNNPTIFPLATDETKEVWNQIKQFSPEDARSLVKICRLLEKVHGKLPH